jgi:type IV secretory pathway VirJ component
MSTFLRMILVLLPALGWWSHPSAAKVVDLSSSNRVRELHTALPDGEPRGIVLLISDSRGWTPAFDAIQAELADDGYAVAGIDLGRWQEAMAMDAGDTECHYVAGDLENAGKLVQRSWSAKRYLRPILAGVGEGATVAMLALANAPPETFQGAVALDGTDVVHSKMPLCPPGAGIPAGSGAFTYGQPGHLAGWLVDARWQRHQPTFPWTQGLADTRSIDVGPVADLAHAMSAALAASRPFATQSLESDHPLSDLPLVELPVTRLSHTFALVLSGDGGWRDIDKSLASVFVQRGLPTVGLDSLRYFWSRRAPAEVAHDIDRIFEHYRERWGTERLALVGYSFGADVLPSVWPLLADETRRGIVQVSLLALGTEADFQFHVTGWIGWSASDARPIPLDLAGMDSMRVQCFFGRDEGPNETGCRSPEAAAFERVERPGGHHFDGNYAVIADQILAGIERRGGGAW